MRVKENTWAFNEMVEWLTLHHGVPDRTARNIAKSLFPHLVEVLLSGKSVLMPGLGTFTVTPVPAKEKRLFGVMRMMPATWSLKFRVAKMFYTNMRKRKAAPRDLVRT